MAWIGISPIERDSTRVTNIRSPYVWYSTGRPEDSVMTRAYEEFEALIEEADEDYVGDDYEDIMEYFSAHSLLGSDGSDQITSLTWQEVLGYASFFENTSAAGEYADFLQNQLGSLSPQIMAMTQEEFLSLLKFEESYDEIGQLSYVASIDLPLPEGYRTVQVRISEVVV